MAGLDEVMERLLYDKEFRTRLATDPAGALAGYTFSDDDREVLAATLTYDEGKPALVEQRTTQSSVAGLLSAFEGVLGPAGPSSASEVGQFSVGANGDSDNAVTWTAIAMAESGGNTSPHVDTPTPGAAFDGTDTGTTVDTLATDNDAEAGGRPGTAHVALSLGDGRTIEAETGVTKSDDGFKAR